MSSLATKYRPSKLEDIVGQDIVKKVLIKQVEQTRFRNAYGFFGASGCGKTTAARAFAKAINHGIGDPIEVDGTTSGDVDSIKQIVETANRRDVTAEYKVIIVDECQMLGGGRKENSPAWSALLKCIEECPKYTIFIFCSTNPEKIPEAILNRLQCFTFSKIKTSLITERLKYVCSCEGLSNFDSACDYISKMSNGSMRESLTNLEKCLDYSTDLTVENVKLVLGDLSYETMFKLTWALTQKKEDEVFKLFDALENSGQDLKQFIDLYLDFVLDLAKYTIFKDIFLTNIPEYLATEDNAVVQYTVGFDGALNYFNRLADVLLETKLDIKYDTSCKSTIIVKLLRLIRG